MIDLGATDPQVAEILNKAVYITQRQIGSLANAESLNEPLPHTSELYRLQEATGIAPLNIDTLLRKALYSASDALEQIAYSVNNSVATTRIALQTMMRVAILGTARTSFVLLPNDPDHRLANAKIVLAQDCHSGIRALREYVEFQGMPGIAPPQALLEDLVRQKEGLLPSGRPPGETTIIKQHTEALIQAFEVAGLEESFSGDILRDHASWLWNTYSGLAHANMWPLLLDGISPDPQIPGDFPLDFYMVANSCTVAYSSYLSRSAPESALTRQDVDLTSELP